MSGSDPRTESTYDYDIMITMNAISDQIMEQTRSASANDMFVRDSGESELKIP